VHIDIDQFFTQLVNFIRTDNEARAIVIQDVPGVGKSSSVEKAAIVAGAVYVSFYANKNLFRTIKSHMVSIIPKDKISAYEWESTLEVLCWHGVSQMFDLARTCLMERKPRHVGDMVVECRENGFHCPEIIPQKLAVQLLEAQACAAASLKELSEFVSGVLLTRKVPILFHLDEMQEWGTTSNFNRKHNSELLSPKECGEYLLPIFSETLQLIANKSARFAFTGTSVNLQRTIRIGTKMKLFPLTSSPPTFSEDIVESIVSIFCNKNIEHLLLFCNL